METNLVDQANQLLNQQSVQQISQPVAAPYYNPNAQPYPTVQAQPYNAQPFNNGTQNLSVNYQSLNGRLCCPKVWTWIIFGYYLFLILFLFTSIPKLSLVFIISTIIYFLVAININRCSKADDVDKYKLALKIFTVYFIIIIFLLVCLLALFLANDWGFIQDLIPILILYTLFEIGIETITLCILCFHKNVFNQFPIQVNQVYHQSIPPQQL